jgi:hypothetical protein
VKPHNIGLTPLPGLVGVLFLADLEIDFSGSYFAQGSHHQTVTFGIDQGMISLVELFDPFGSQHDQKETVIDIFKTIFDGYAGHNLVLLPATK